jgi:hypothetical protein
MTRLSREPLRGFFACGSGEVSSQYHYLKVLKIYERLNENTVQSSVMLIDEL